MSVSAGASGSFWISSPENGDLNQYWFSPASIEVLVEQVRNHGPRAALISCPSVYFSLPSGSQHSCKLLDFDTTWDSDPGFVFYDFNHPEAVPLELHHTFDLAVVDPPYITREVWSKYATTAKLLVKEGSDERGTALGRLLCTSIAENAPMLYELLAVKPRRFRPSIPSLVYQYHTYTNYESERLMQSNFEVDSDDHVPMPPSSASAEAAAAWEATYGATSGRADELLSVIGPREAGWEAALADSSTVHTTASEPEITAVMGLRVRLAELKQAISGLDGVLLAVVQKAERFAGLKDKPLESAKSWSARRMSVDKALADRDVALDELSRLAAVVDDAQVRVAEALAASVVKATDWQMPPYTHVARSISEGAAAIRPYSPRSGRKDVATFSAGNRQHLQRIFKHQTALLAQMKELRRTERIERVTCGSC